MSISRFMTYYKKENPDSSPALSLGEELPGLRCKSKKNI